MVHNYKAFAVQLSDDDHKSQVLPHGSGNNASLQYLTKKEL